MENNEKTGTVHPRLRHLIWPPVRESRYRRIAIWMGVLAAFFHTVNYAIVALAGPIMYLSEPRRETLLTSLRLFVIGAVAALIGWGIYKRKKAASVAGLVLSTIALIANAMNSGILHANSLYFVFMAYMFIQSTRGILAFHKADDNLENGSEEPGR